LSFDDSGIMCGDWWGDLFFTIILERLDFIFIYTIFLFVHL
jgi:hypothetical protein